jgi:hypothetical protein
VYRKKRGSAELCAPAQIMCRGQFPPTLFRDIDDVVLALALPHILTFSAAPFPCAPPGYRSCSFLLRLCTPSFVSSRGI